MAAPVIESIRTDVMATSQNDFKNQGEAGELPPLTQLLRSIALIEDHIREFLAIIGTTIDLSGPQWSILLVINELGGERGVAVKEVARMLGCDLLCNFAVQAP